MPERTRNFVLAALAAAAGLLLTGPGTAVAQEADDNLVPPETVKLLFEQRVERDFVPGEIIVKMKEDAPPDTDISIAAAPQMGLEPAEQPTSGGEIVFRIGASISTAMTPEDLKQATLSTVESFQADPNVEYAQPNYYLRIAATPDDPLYPRQWHYFDNGTGAGQSPGGIGLPAAWDVTTGNSVVVAVIDTGILPGHPDITGSPNLVAGHDMISNTFVANDGDGRDGDPTDPGDAVGPGQCGPGSPPMPDSWHGTHVAGTVGVVRTGNALGVAGVNWNVRVQPVRVLGRCGGLTTDINDGIRWAAGLPVPGVPANPTPADVINLSLRGVGSCSTSPSQQAAIDDAVAAGTTVVVAAGNDAANAAGFHPASCNGVITVAAADYRGRLVTRYSNFGDSVEILAPGGDIDRDDNGDGFPDGVLSTVDGGYAYYNGTSMAAPHVAGAAALLLAQSPGLTPAQVLARLQASALPRSTTECPQPCGAGLLQVDFDGGPTISVTPASLDLGKGDVATLTLQVRDSGGAALPGVTINLQSANSNIATVGAAVVTDASGNAQATVTAGQTRGNTTVTAEALGAQKQVPVKVPTLSFWALLIAAAAMMLWLRRRALRGAGG